MNGISSPPFPSLCLPTPGVLTLSLLRRLPFLRRLLPCPCAASSYCMRSAYASHTLPAVSREATIASLLAVSISSLRTAVILPSLLTASSLIALPTTPPPALGALLPPLAPSFSPSSSCLSATLPLLAGISSPCPPSRRLPSHGFYNRPILTVHPSPRPDPCCIPYASSFPLLTPFPSSYHPSASSCRPSHLLGAFFLFLHSVSLAPKGQLSSLSSLSPCLLVLHAFGPNSASPLPIV
ncbi:hypothetical protein EDB86DRAFT_2097190 [Lactarius hatsudake]|nr:hypothetical protein EDB86DRAFT_2097190 [Lactarius hatsudake]